MRTRPIHLPPRKPASYAAIVAVVLAAVCLGAIIYLVIGLQRQQDAQNRNRDRLVQLRNDQIAEIHEQLCQAIAAIPAKNPAGLQEFERSIQCPVTTPAPVPTVRP